MTHSFNKIKLVVMQKAKFVCFLYVLFFESSFMFAQRFLITWNFPTNSFLLPTTKSQLCPIPSSMKFKMKWSHIFLPHSETFHRSWGFVRCQFTSLCLSGDNEDVDRNFPFCDDTHWAIESQRLRVLWDGFYISAQSVIFGPLAVLKTAYSTSWEETGQH